MNNISFEFGISAQRAESFGPLGESDARQRQKSAIKKKNKMLLLLICQMWLANIQSKPVE